MILILMGWATEIRRHREQLPATQEVCTGPGVPHPRLARVGGRRARPPIANSLSFRGPTVFVAPRNLSERFLATLEMTPERSLARGGLCPAPRMGPGVRLSSRKGGWVCFVLHRTAPPS